MIFLGYDPGGVKNANGAAVLDLNGPHPLVQTASLCSVDGVMSWFQERLAGQHPTAAGIDCFLYWETGKCGWRASDKWLKQQYPHVQQSIFSSNSAFGSMSVQGMAMAMRMKQTWPNVHLNETHPKVLYKALSGEKYDWSPEMNSWLKDKIGTGQDVEIQSDHEWDALISAWATMLGYQKKWTEDLRDLSVVALEPAGNVTYWWPESSVS